MNTIKSKETRGLFLTKKNMPKKEYLLSLEQIFEELKKPLPESSVERHYASSVNRSVVLGVKRYFHEHHIMFICPRIDGVVRYGFSQDIGKIDNYMDRLKKITKSHATVESGVKVLLRQIDLFKDDPETIKKIC